MTPPITITPATEDYDAITYQCGDAIVWRDEPAGQDRVSLSINGGEAISRAAVREWAALLNHSAIADLISGDDTAPAPPSHTQPLLRLAGPSGEHSPITLLTFRVAAALERQQTRLGLTQAHVSAVALVVAHAIEQTFGLPTGTDTGDVLPAAHPLPDSYQQGWKDGRKALLEALMTELGTAK